MTLEMQSLLKIEDHLRDEDWERSFLLELPKARFKVLSEAPQTGPDQWPYLFVELSEEGPEPFDRLVEWLASQGVGLVINPQSTVPDYVFTYGMIWYYSLTKNFFNTTEPVKQLGQIQFKEGQKVLAGPPTNEYLPAHVRSILKEFFMHQNILEPKILVMGDTQQGYDLCFSLESLGNPPKMEHRGILEALSWFLPTHYSLVIVSEKGLPPFYGL